MKTNDTSSSSGSVVKLRSLFISDLHLGMRGCRAELLLDFLAHHDFDRIYLVGDIIDGWRLKAKWYWPNLYDRIVSNVLSRVHTGATVFCIPGNHDAFLREPYINAYAGVRVVDQVIHQGVDGRRYLVIHGDQFDVVCRRARWLSVVGDMAYRAAMSTRAPLNCLRPPNAPPAWSFSAWAKGRVKHAVQFFSKYETVVTDAVTRWGVQGIICGHTHDAVVHDDFGVRYVNTGDWVESCTAVVEHFDGKLEIVRWPKVISRSEKTPGTSRGQGCPAGRLLQQQLRQSRRNLAGKRRRRASTKRQESGYSGTGAIRQ